MTPREGARAIVARAITTIVPDADVAAVSDDADLRRTFELDSLDFQELVELLSQDTGVRIEEEDYPELSTLSRFQRFLDDAWNRGAPAARDDSGTA